MTHQAGFVMEQAWPSSLYLEWVGKRQPAFGEVSVQDVSVVSVAPHRQLSARVSLSARVKELTRW